MRQIRDSKYDDIARKIDFNSIVLVINAQNKAACYNTTLHIVQKINLIGKRTQIKTIYNG